MKRNNDMKHLSYHYIVALLAACLLSATFAGCTREADEPVADGCTATIRLDIPMLEADTRVDVKGDENAINQLRVIILSQGAESINKIFTATDLADGSITIDNVPVGPVQMYVIANEASLGKDYNNLLDLKNDVVDVDGKRKVLIKDESRTYFPKRGSATEFPATGLPMSWMNKNLTIEPPTAGTPQTVSVNLVRTVAKLNITMNNALSDPITINGMSFGAFFGDCLYLFAEQDLDVPDDTGYDSKEYTGLNIEIAGGETAQLTLYIYPSFAWTNPLEDSPYTIGFHTAAGNEYIPQSFVNNYGALNSIARNTQVNIHATLSTPANVEISFEVVPWAEKSVEVPPFN